MTADTGGGGVWTFYYIQGEDGEDRFHPNAFKISSSELSGTRDVTLADIQKHLPLSDPHAFHYRFRLNGKSGVGGSGGTTFFWLDLTAPSQKVPVTNGRVICKLLRLLRPIKRGVIFKRKTVVLTSKENASHARPKPNTADDHFNTPSQQRLSQPSSGATHSTRSSKYSDTGKSPTSSEKDGAKEARGGGHENENDGGSKTDGSSVSKVKRSSTSSESFEDFLMGSQGASVDGSAKANVDLLQEDGWDNGTSTPSAGTASHNFMNTMDPLAGRKRVPPKAPVQRNSVAPPKFEDDGGQTVGPVSMSEMKKYSKTTSDGSNVYNSKFVDKSSKSEDVRRAMEDRERQVKLDIEKARNELRQREEATRSLTAQKEAVSATLGPTLKAWAEDNGRVKNIRTLLSTMHTVMWEGSRWTEVNMGKLLQPNDVKKHYRKAMIVVHPDKSGGRNAEQLLIAERVFAAVNSAWDDFLKANPC